MSQKEKNNLRNMFRGYKKMNSSMIKKLKGYGLTVSNIGKHYKIQRNDDVGGFVTLAKTPSDIRSGLNFTNYLLKLLEA